MSETDALREMLRRISAIAALGYVATEMDAFDQIRALADTAVSATWPGLMAGFAPAPTDRTTTNSGDTGGPSLDTPKGSV
jgi:hypothetical protein